MEELDLNALMCSLVMSLCSHDLLNTLNSSKINSGLNYTAPGFSMVEYQLVIQ